MEADAGQYLEAVLLGVVQALTEFLPISSSGHLVLVPRVLGREPSSLTFDVALHLGTVVAVIGYFWRDWAAIVAAGLRDVATEGVAVRRWSPRARLGLWLVLATIPAVIVGALFSDWIDEHAREPVVVGVMLILFGVLLGLADRWGGLVGRLLDMTPGRAFAVGVAQAAALIPGVSRSGATITAGRALGFDRISAARFSFLLSAPVILGAGILSMAEALTGGEEVAWGPLVVGAVTAAAVGALVIGVFMRFIQRRTLAAFVWYRIALGAAVLVAVAAGAL
ncbi:MAG: undecaprenyl-diphosphatase UppP [Dehalococcoidia bacterium]|nr:undecaprenyl-diphosphatase UppP [Dehalococcoidia bacterium]